MTTATAPGKIILFGEHAVVYGQPALAVPVTQVQATATLLPSPTGRGAGGEGSLWIEALNLNRRYRAIDGGPNDVLSAAALLTCARAGVPLPDGVTISVDSTIPFASGLGSGAAVCVALVRALSQSLNLQFSNAQISSIVYETEKLLHGTPSGIDNTVIAYEQPVYFIKGGKGVQLNAPTIIPFTVAQPIHLLIADTGIHSPTKHAVADVRALWEQAPARYDKIFADIGDIAREARALIEGRGVQLNVPTLGELMNRNHALLQTLTVSCPELDTLVEAARAAGALGAKLSGGGRGGNMLALVTPETEDRVRLALERAGAVRVIGTVVS